MKFSRTEYPKPQFKRQTWQPLNGEWQFCFDDGEDGIAKNYPLGETDFDKTIQVPFCYQTKASGIQDLSMHEVMWYKRTFRLEPGLVGGNVLLCFNAVDYEADVWLNGKYVTGHKNGYTYFDADVTDYLKEENRLVVRAVDRYDTCQPRGKQFWKKQPDRCWYHANSGIWQSVWLERVGADRLKKCLVTPDLDRNSFSAEAETCGAADTLNVTVSYGGKVVKRQTVTLDGKFTKFTVELSEEDSIDEIHYWWPESPNLYGLSYELSMAGKTVDKVESYFGFRKIHYDGSGKIYLNNKILYQKLVLDQGYWEDSDLTPPSAEALKQDILYAKEMGFNGGRKHQKIEDPYYYYYADTLGFLVWGEMPSAYHYNRTEVALITSQYLDLVSQLYNHPSIITWVPLNESWGVRKMLTDGMQKDFCRSLYYLTKAVDATRLISSNDGWENVEENDIVSIHDYAAFGDDFEKKYTEEQYDGVYPMGRRLMSHGESYLGQPVIMTEYGGIAFAEAAKNGAWGYGASEKSEETFLKRLKSLNRGIYACRFAGFCYTQLSDVKQEVNGLLDRDHKPKFDLKLIADINDGKAE